MVRNKVRHKIAKIYLWEQNVDKLNDNAENDKGMNGGKVVQVLHHHEAGQNHNVLDFSHTKTDI